jgi:hypothetical protein
MEQQEFKTLFDELMSVPEAENPALYERVRRFKERVHERIQRHSLVPPIPCRDMKQFSSGIAPCGLRSGNDNSHASSARGPVTALFE